MVTVYIIREEYAASLRREDDLHGFKEFVDDGVYWLSYEFTTPSEAGNFCGGVCSGHTDERAPLGILILRDDIEVDIPYIKALTEA